MTNEDPGQLQSDGITLGEAEELVRALGLIFSNTFLYGQEHGVTVKAVDDGFVSVDQCLTRVPEISFSISDDDLMVDVHSVEQKNPLMRMFVTHLSDREIANFTLFQGMTKDAFKNLVEVFIAKPEELKQLGGFSAAIQTLGLQFVKAKQIMYKQVTEDEEIIDKNKKKDLEDKAKDGGGSPEEIVAFLQGDVIGEKMAPDLMRPIATDADKLGELVMRAVEIREKGPDLESGETLSDLVVGCLNKAYDALSKDPSVKTKKGKAALKKTLMLLEKNILDKMRNITDELAESEIEAVSGAIEGMTEGLEIDGLAGEYMKKRNQIETNEKRILRFIKSRGLDKVDETDLEARLIAGGLTPEGWRELLVKSGIAGSGKFGVDTDGGGLASVGELSMLLSKLEGASGEDGQAKKALSAEDLGGVLKSVHEEVSTIVEHTEEKIDMLVKSVQSDALITEEMERKALAEGKAPALTRKRLMEILAEIAQELCQPLAVINCSLDMMLSKTLGEVTDTQVDMLKLASESSEKLKVLVDDLMDISGLPDTMSPDAGIQTSLYEES